MKKRDILEQDIDEEILQRMPVWFRRVREMHDKARRT
jgi:hypothetical protein